MITYYGTVISPHQIETGEGFLICRNVPIARTGEQDYMADEVGRSGGGIVKVLRPEEEVFSPAAIASFEGKPLTNDHPPVQLTPENVSGYRVGHVQNVRRGSGEWTDYLVADLHIQDADAISAVQGGKRQISCGYECEYVDNGDGTLTQKGIRGNHVALVTEGRAGARAAIMDSKYKPAETPERKPMSKKNTFLHFFGLAASGKSDEEVRKLAMDAADALDADPAEGEKPGEEEQPAPAPAADEDTDYQKKLFESIDGVGGKLDQLIAMLTPKAPEEEKPADEDPIEAALDLIEEKLHGEEPAGDEKPAEEAEDPAADEEEAHVVPAEEMDEEAAGAGCMDAATAKEIITALRTPIAQITDEKQRKAVSDALLQVTTGKKQPVSDAAKVAKAAQANAKKNQKTPAADLDAVQALYDARNPHLKKKEV